MGTGGVEGTGRGARGALILGHSRVPARMCASKVSRCADTAVCTHARIRLGIQMLCTQLAGVEGDRMLN